MPHSIKEGKKELKCEGNDENCEAFIKMAIFILDGIAKDWSFDDLIRIVMQIVKIVLQIINRVMHS